ncbi:hypothetical protein NFI96_007742 [Prochilodus magdalenae]|nr:hypothetical protein NFI96_007742 [Prochilodus magdalenae]
MAWSSTQCDKPFILVLTTVPPHTDSSPPRLKRDSSLKMTRCHSESLHDSLIIVWGNYGRMDRKCFMGVARILLEELDLTSMVIGWYKLFPTSSMVDPTMAPLIRHSSQLSLESTVGPCCERSGLRVYPKTCVHLMSGLYRQRQSVSSVYGPFRRGERLDRAE